MCLLFNNSNNCLRVAVGIVLQVDKVCTISLNPNLRPRAVRATSLRSIDTVIGIRFLVLSSFSVVHCAECSPTVIPDPQTHTYMYIHLVVIVNQVNHTHHTTNLTSLPFWVGIYLRLFG